MDHELGFEYSDKNHKLFNAHFVGASDEQTAVLKAHLLIESMLRDFCLKSVRDATYLQEARLSFKQIALLARSLCSPELAGLNHCWLLIDKVNSLRNMMAHELEPDPDRMAKIRDAILTITQQNNVVPQAGITELRGCLGFLCGMLDALLQSCVAFEALQEAKRGTSDQAN